MHYGLAHKEESYYADKIKKVVQLAPCSVSTGIPNKDGKPDIPTYEATDWNYQDMGIFNVGGPNWTDGKKNLKKGCDTFGDGWCAYFTQYTHGIYGGDGQVFGIQDQLHWDFNYIQNRFQEFAPDYIKKGVQ